MSDEARLTMSIELGQASIKVEDTFDFDEPSLVEIDHSVQEEPVDILLNSTLFAKGKVVTIDEDFALRIIEVVNPGAIRPQP